MTAGAACRDDESHAGRVGWRGEVTVFTFAMGLWKRTPWSRGAARFQRVTGE
jgi:hypothetical protein